MREKLLKKLREIVHDGYWEHINCSKECGKRTMEEQQLEIYADELLEIVTKN